MYLGIAHWDSLGQIIEQTEIANELNVTPVLENTGIQKKLFAT